MLFEFILLFVLLCIVIILGFVAIGIKYIELKVDALIKRLEGK